MRFKILVFALIALASQACHRPGTIKVVNEISGVRMENIHWGEFALSGSLLPGQSTSELTIRRTDQKLPADLRITFELSANGNTVALRTAEAYRLEPNDDLVVVIDDETLVE